MLLLEIVLASILPSLHETPLRLVTLHSTNSTKRDISNLPPGNFETCPGASGAQNMAVRLRFIRDDVVMTFRLCL